MTTTATTPVIRQSTIKTPRRRRRDRTTLLCVALLLLLFAVPLRGLLRAEGGPMEEGFMLVFPERVLRGDVPNVDFLHLYGPGGLWALAGVFKVFGVSLLAERLVALAQQVALVLAVFAVARRWGRTTAVTGAGVAAVLTISPIGLVALAWVGALALGLWAVHCAIESLDRPDGPSSGAWRGRPASWGGSPSSTGPT